MKDYGITMETGSVSNRPIIRKKSISLINIGIVKSGKKLIFQKRQGEELVKFKSPSTRVCLIRAEKIENKVFVGFLVIYCDVFS